MWCDQKLQISLDHDVRLFCLTPWSVNVTILTYEHVLPCWLVSVSGGMRVAFTASMSGRTNCFGPFTRNSPIPYDVITLNHGSGYNPALGKCSQVPCKRVVQPRIMYSMYQFKFNITLFVPGIFTAPRSGLYSFSFSVYSKVAKEGERMYYKVQLMRNNEVVASIWEDNREDSEDSSSQTVLLSLQRGGQVYLELMNGRQICGIVEGLNTFSGALIYSTLA